MADADLERALEPLRAAYRRKLPGRLAQLGALLGRARDPHGTQQLEAARELAHTLKGTSGSYGLNDVSVELGRIEEHLVRLLEGAPADSADLWEDIERALMRAGDRLESPRDGPA